LLFSYDGISFGTARSITLNGIHGEQQMKKKGPQKRWKSTCFNVNRKEAELGSDRSSQIIPLIMQFLTHNDSKNGRMMNESIQEKGWKLYMPEINRIKKLN